MKKKMSRRDMWLTSICERISDSERRDLMRLRKSLASKEN